MTYARQARDLSAWDKNETLKQMKNGKINNTTDNWWKMITKRQVYKTQRVISRSSWRSLDIENSQSANKSSPTPELSLFWHVIVFHRLPVVRWQPMHVWETCQPSIASSHLWSHIRITLCLPLVESVRPGQSLPTFCLLFVRAAITLQSHYNIL